MKLTEEYKAKRALDKKIAKEEARVLAEKTANPVKRMDIEIEWKSSRTWGANPHLEAFVVFKDGTYTRFHATCSGCGYDKTSTVVAELFNAFLKYKLWARQIKGNPGLPYGMSEYEGSPKEGYGPTRYYCGGIGVNCYPNIAEFIGGEFVRTANGKMYDAFTYTDNEE